MLVMQSQNLVKILEDLGYGETKECTEFKLELERLRSISRVGMEGYWRVNWGYDRNSSNSHSNFVRRSDSVNRQNLPLPELPIPKRSLSPILGTETPTEEDEQTTRQTVEFVQIHDLPDSSTNL